jgi:hypothetical protein
MSDQTPPDGHEVGGVADPRETVAASATASTPAPSQAAPPQAGGEDKLFSEVPMSGDNQIILLGLAVAAAVLFGAVIWGFFFG